MKRTLFTVLMSLLLSLTVSAADKGKVTYKQRLQRLFPSTLQVLPSQSGMEQPAVPYALQSSPAKGMNRAIFDQPDGVVNIWGILMYDFRYQTHGIIKMSSDAPSNYALLKGYGNSAGATNFVAMTYVGEELYAYACRSYGYGAILPMSIGVIDPVTGEYTSRYELPGGTTLMFNDMTYDENTKLIYATEYGYNTQEPEKSFSKIHTINPKTFEIKEVATVNHLLLGLSTDQGDFYALAQKFGDGSTADNNSYLVKITAANVANGSFTAETINYESGLGLGFGNGLAPLQSIEFDKTTHKLWWLAQSSTQNSPTYLAEIDYKTGKVKEKTRLSVITQIAGLSIPYQVVASGAPGAPTKVTLKRGDKGALTATLTWTNPTHNYQNEVLTSLSGVKIYRNGQEVATVNTTEVGKAGVTWTDSNVPESGYYNYKIEPFNAAGAGVYREASSFIGRDKPGEVRTLQLTATGSDASLSWTAPVSGINGGWIDLASLKYKVTRYPDMKVIATDLTTTSLTDKVETFAGYYYEVLPYNSDGEGKAALSNVVPFGPNLSIPYINSMKTADEFNQWAILDANKDGVSWVFSKDLNVASYVYNLNSAKDFLITPPLMFEDGKEYQIRYTYWTTNWVEGPNQTPVNEKMRVKYGTSPTEAGLSQLVKDLGEFHTSSGNYLHGKNNFKAKAGVGYVAFEVYSDPDRGIVYLKDISIREYSARDLSVGALNGSSMASVNGKQVYGTDVTNEGSAKVSSFRLELYNVATNEVLASADINEDLEPGATKNFSVEWTPTAEGTGEVKVRVVLDGETFPADNVTEKSVQVKVSSEGSDKWVSVNSATEGVSGWYFPFNLGQCYSFTQIIYLGKEMQLKDINLTGIQFFYDGAANLVDHTAALRVSIANTNANNFDCIDAENYRIPLLEEDYTMVFDGNIKVGGKEKNTPLNIKFDTPFMYRGGNIVVQFERTYTEDRLTEKEGYMPLFLYNEIYNEGSPARYRSARYYSNVNDVIDPDQVARHWWVPYTMFSYTTAAGIEGVMAADGSLRVYQSGNSLVFSAPFTRAELFTTTGAAVRKAQGGERLSVSGLKGVYLLKATVNGKVQTLKVTIK